MLDNRRHTVRWGRVCRCILLNVHPRVADLVFSSFTSTRARVELVRKASIMCLPHEQHIQHLEKLCNQFDSVSQMRNKLCHAEYMLGPRNLSVIGLLSTNYQRKDFDGTNQYEQRQIDKGFLNEIRQASRAAVSLCHRLERFEKKHKGHVLAQPRSQPVMLRKRQPNPRSAQGKAKGRHSQRQS